MEAHSTMLRLVHGESDEQRAETMRHCVKLSSHYCRFVNGAAKALQPGMFAVWKTGLKNRRTPDYGVPMVVVEVLAEFTRDAEHGPGSMYYREPLDLVLGFIDDDGDFCTLHYDSRRFEPYQVRDLEQARIGEHE